MILKKLLNEWKWTISGLIVILAIGFGFRLVNLTILPVFVDEAIYVRWSQVMATEPTLRFLPLSDGKQPLFMWILMFLIKYFSDPLLAGRLISVFASVGTAVGIFVFSYSLFKNKITSLLSLLLYIFSPFIFFFDRMALVDSLLSMFGIWTAVFGYLTAKYKRLDLAMVTGFFLGFAMLTKSPALFVVLLLPTFYLLNSWKGIWRVGVPYIIAFGMYNILRLGPNFELLASRTGDYVLPLSHAWTNTLDPLIPHLKDFFVWIMSMGPSVLIPLALLGLYIGLKKYAKETLVLLVWILFPLFVQAELGITFTARYTLFIMPYVFMLAGMVAMIHVKWLRVVSYGLIVIFVLQSFIFDYYLLTNPEKANLPRGERSGYLEEWTAGQGIKEISEYLRLILPAGRQVVVGTEGYFGTLPDGLQIYTNDLKNVVVVGVGVVITETPKSLTESFAAGNKTYMIVNKSRFNGNAEAQGLKLIARYPKGLRLLDSQQYAKYGPQEELLFFELTK